MAKAAGAYAPDGSLYVTSVDGSGNVIAPGQIVGTATNDSASAGNVGEFNEIIVAASTVNLTTITAATISSFTLQPGDHDLNGVCSFVPANTTIPTQFVACWSLTTNVLDVTLGRVTSSPLVGATYDGVTTYHLVMPTARFSIAVATPVFLVAFCRFTVAGCTAGGELRRRRMR